MRTLMARSLADTASARRHLERLASGEPGRQTVERLRFFVGVRALQLTAQAGALELGNGDRAALVVAGDTKLDIADPLQDFCTLLSDDEVCAVLIAKNGSLKAAGRDWPTTADTPCEKDDATHVRIGTARHTAQVAVFAPDAPTSRLIVAHRQAEEAPDEQSPMEQVPPMDRTTTDRTTTDRTTATDQTAKETDHTVATSSFPRSFFPWSRFLKGLEAGEDEAQTSAPEGAENANTAPAPSAEVPATPAPKAFDLLAKARAAKQKLVDEDDQLPPVTEEPASEPELRTESPDEDTDESDTVQTEADAETDAVDADTPLPVEPLVSPEPEDEPETDEIEEAAKEVAPVISEPHEEEAEIAPDEREADVFAPAAPAVAALAASAVAATADEEEARAEDETPVEATAEVDDAVAEEITEETESALAADEAQETMPVPDETADAETPAIPAFEFDNDGRPVRFVWQMNVEQVFTGVSPELAQVIGPEAADTVGRNWADVAEQLNLDPEGRVAAALVRRDTWSGVTVEWPVSDNPLAVPVDLAALPAFDRFRQFKGYRGFGVCRPADAVTMESMRTSAPVEEDAPEEPASEDLTPPQDATPEVADHDEAATEPEASSTDTAVAVAAATAAGMAGVSLLASEEAEAATPEAKEPVEEPADEIEEAVMVADEEHAEETDEDLQPEPEGPVTAESGAEDEGEEIVEETTLPEPTEPVATQSDEEHRVADLPGRSQPSPTYGLYHERTKTAPQWDLPEAANSQDAVTAAEDESAQGDVAALERQEFVETDDEEPAPSPVVIVETDESEVLGAEPAQEAQPDGSDSDISATSTAGLAAAAAAGLAAIRRLNESESEDESSTAAETSEASDGEALEIEAPDVEPEQIEAAEAEVEAVEETGGLPEETDETSVEPVSEALEGPAEDLVEEEPEPLLPMGDLTDTAEEPVDARTATDEEIEAETASEPKPEAEAEPEPAPEAEAAPEVEGDESFTETVVRLAERQVIPPDSQLSRPEREAFRKIAEALGARIEETNKAGDEKPEGKDVPPIPMPIAPRPTPRAKAPEEEVPSEQAAPIHPRLLDRLPIVRDRDVEYTNKSLLKMLGYADLGELAEAGGLEAVFAPPEEWPPKPAGSATIERTLCVRLSDGTPHPIDAFMHTVPWKGGSGLMISLREKRDASAEEASAELAQSRERISELESVLETATDGVIVLDADGRIISVNRSGEALFNASRQMMQGATITDYLAPESHRSALDYLDGLAHNGVVSVLNDGREVIGQLSDGGLIPLFMTIGRIGQPADKDNAKFCAVLRDITQWKKVEEELTTAKRQAENASSQKSDFLAKINHEIRTPLNAIIGFSEVMMDERFGAIGNKRYKDYLKDIHASGTHLLSLINDLLDLSKVEAGKFELAFEAVPINKVLRDCVALMQPQANRDRVIIRTSLPESVPKVVADPRSVRQIVLNLLSNAIKFNQAGGQVIVSTALEPKGEMVMRVRDTGMGMSRKDIEAALEPFRQLHTARLGGGTGLGLPLTKALVEANRAGFSIDSEPNQGTLVEITFPSQRVLVE
ncbi:ATP-binding protein [Breoghania sp.]|uniref:PAS domain-containing sensor histidine kinase n=1 Tax=Breoghania sp. TaxID=2065378 RepID=UPI00261E5BB3|nr:ATP-binding protein [Breoghania sp.]